MASGHNIANSLKMRVRGNLVNTIYEGIESRSHQGPGHMPVKCLQIPCIYKEQQGGMEIVA